MKAGCRQPLAPLARLTSVVVPAPMSRTKTSCTPPSTSSVLRLAAGE
jgi:hypothetical protein